MVKTDKDFYDKKIVYLDYLERGEKVKNGGFVKWEARGETSRVQIHIRGLYPTDTLRGELQLISREKAYTADSVKIDYGTGEYVAVWKNEDLAGTAVSYGECDGVQVRLSESRMLAGQWRVREAVKENPPESAPPVLEVRMETADMRNESAEGMFPGWRRVDAAEAESRAGEGAASAYQEDTAKENKEAPAEEADMEERNGKIIQGEPDTEEEKGTQVKEEKAAAEEQYVTGKKWETPVEERDVEAKREEMSSEERSAVEKRREAPSEERNVEERRWEASSDEQSVAEKRREVPSEERSVAEKSREAPSDERNAAKKGWEAPSQERTMAAKKEEAPAAKGASLAGEAAQKRKEDSEPQSRCLLSGDKWEQLNKQYPHIHPFGDAREYLSITPRDFIVLSRKYQNLVQNSFLLHGYYNYGHVILTKIRQKEGDCFYLGVPGVYFTREKQAALMFGFEGFEAGTEQAVDGGFGYYMKQVDI